MADKIIKILSENDKEPQLRALAEDYSAITFWDKRGSDNNNYEFNIVVPAEYVQALTDKIQTALGSEKGWHILTLKLESIIPRQDDQQDVGGNENAKKLLKLIKSTSLLIFKFSLYFFAFSTITFTKTSSLYPSPLSVAFS